MKLVWKLISILMFAVLGCLSCGYICFHRTASAKQADALEERIKNGPVTEAEVLRVLDNNVTRGTVASNDWILRQDSYLYLKGKFDSRCISVIEFDVDNADSLKPFIFESPQYEYIRVGVDKDGNVCAYARALH